MIATAQMNDDLMRLRDRVDIDPMSGLGILSFQAKNGRFDDIPTEDSGYDPTAILPRERFTYDEVMRRGRQSIYYDKQMQFEQDFVRPMTNRLCEEKLNNKIRRVEATGQNNGGALITSPNVFYQNMPANNGARVSTNYGSGVNMYSSDPFQGHKEFALTKDEIAESRQIAGLSAFFTRPMMDIMPPDHNYHTHTMTLHDVFDKNKALSITMVPLYEHLKSAQSDAMTDLLFPNLPVPDGNAIHGIRVARSMFTAHYLENRADEAPTGLVEKTHMSTSMRVQQAGKSMQQDLRSVQRPEGRALLQEQLVQIGHATTRSVKLSCCVSLVQAAMPPSGHIDQKAGYIYESGIFKIQEMNAILDANATNFLRLQKPPAQAGLQQFTKFTTDIVENFKDRGLEASPSNIVVVVDSKMFTWLGPKTDQPFFITGRQPRMTPNYGNMMTINGVRIVQMPEFPKSNKSRINMLRQPRSIGEFYPMSWKAPSLPDAHSFQNFRTSDCDIRISNLHGGSSMSKISFAAAVKNALEILESLAKSGKNVGKECLEFACGLTAAVVNTVVLNKDSPADRLYDSWSQTQVGGTIEKKFAEFVNTEQKRLIGAKVDVDVEVVKAEMPGELTSNFSKVSGLKWLTEMCLKCHIPLVGMNVLAVRPHITMQTYSAIAIAMGTSGNKVRDAPGLYAIDTKTSAAGVHAANQSFVYSYVAVYGSMIHNPRAVININDVAVDKYMFGGGVTPYEESDISKYKTNNAYHKDLFFMLIDDKSLASLEERSYIDIASKTPYLDTNGTHYSPLAEAYANHFGWSESKMQFNDVLSVHTNAKKKGKQTICYRGDYEVRSIERPDKGQTTTSNKWDLCLGNGPRRGHVTKEALDVYKGTSPMFPSQPELQINISSGVKVH